MSSNKNNNRTRMNDALGSFLTMPIDQSLYAGVRLVRKDDKEQMKVLFHEPRNMKSSRYRKYWVKLEILSPENIPAIRQRMKWIGLCWVNQEQYSVYFGDKSIQHPGKDKNEPSKTTPNESRISDQGE